MTIDNIREIAKLKEQFNNSKNPREKFRINEQILKLQKLEKNGAIK